MVKDRCKPKNDQGSLNLNESENQALYDPLSDNFVTNKFVSDFCSFVYEQITCIQFSHFLSQCSSVRLSDSESGSLPRGCVLSYQCRHASLQVNATFHVGILDLPGRCIKIE